MSFGYSIYPRAESGEHGYAKGGHDNNLMMMQGQKSDAEHLDDGGLPYYPTLNYIFRIVIKKKLTIPM